MSASEFSRMIDLRAIGPQAVTLEASAEEAIALARRFDLVAIRSLRAELSLAVDGPVVEATGTLKGAIVQSCAVSGEDLPVRIDEKLAMRFVPEQAVDEEELELSEGELDEIGYAGTSIDLGEAIAQSLALAIDPYATGPEAERARQKAGLSTPEASGPFAALAALKKD